MAESVIEILRTASPIAIVTSYLFSDSCFIGIVSCRESICMPFVRFIDLNYWFEFLFVICHIVCKTFSRYFGPILSPWSMILTTFNLHYVIQSLLCGIDNIFTRKTIYSFRFRNSEEKRFWKIMLIGIVIFYKIFFKFSENPVTIFWIWNVWGTRYIPWFFHIFFVFSIRMALIRSWVAFTPVVTFPHKVTFNIKFTSFKRQFPSINPR